jgi:serine/threonine protein kinase
VHYCLVTLLAGRPLHEYQSVKELLEALRDAIRGHRSLLRDGKILHRDISENNIIITELPAEDALKGRLIDLDLAKELNSMPSKARHRTGTMQFMAIEVLEGKGHTYRHDLESFFYVFIWICIRYSYEGTGRQKFNKVMRPKRNILRGWYTVIYLEITQNKVGDIGKNRFKNIIVEFAPKFENLKLLARELQSGLFPIRDRDIFTGTFQDHNIMYDGMINAINGAISILGQE